MTPRAAQIRLLKSLGFKLVDRDPDTPKHWVLLWEHPTGVQVAFLPSERLNARRVVAQALTGMAVQTLDRVESVVQRMVGETKARS